VAGRLLESDHGRHAVQDPTPWSKSDCSLGRNGDVERAQFAGSKPRHASMRSAIAAGKRKLDGN